MLLDQVVERAHGKFYWTCHSTMELQCHIMISRGRSSRAMTPPILARIIKSHFQVRRLDPNVCSPALVFRYWKFNNHTATTEVETEHFGGDLRAPPAEVTTFELFCTFNSIICQFCERWMSLFPCGSQTPNPVWKWQASCQNHHPAHDGSPRSGQQGFKHWQINTAWKKSSFFQEEKLSERENCGSLFLRTADRTMHFCESTFHFQFQSDSELLQQKTIDFFQQDSVRDVSH